MNELIARCLEVSRDFAEQDSVELDLCDLLAGVAAEFAHTGVDIRGRKGPDCRLRIRPLALRRILANLVHNAIQYTPAGGSVTIEARPVNGEVLVRVRDTGPGLSEADRAIAFSRFERGSASANGAGLGLGLALAHEIARAHGGEIWATSEPGRGTTFVFTLPTGGRATPPRQRG